MNFFVLEERDRFSREGAGRCFYDIEDPLHLEPGRDVCPACHAVCGPQVWLPPRTIRPSGRACGDLLTGVAFELVVSETFRDAYLAAGLSGLSDFGPVLLTRGKHDNYFAARPKITFTRLNERASGVEWEQEPSCDNCGLGVVSKLERAVIDERTWDGSDIFMGTGLYGVKLVTERFVGMVRDADLSNFDFVPAGEFSKP